jgi:prephenate dehydrogenase
MEVLVVGAGTMGCWFGECALDAGWEPRFADADAGTARTAAEALGTDVADVDGGREYDVVCLAVPISVVTSSVREQAPRATRAVFDVSGVMAAPVAAMDEAVPERERASLHPLFAPSNEPGNVACVTSEEGAVVDRLYSVLGERGNHVFETTPEEHDRAMGTVQARAHAAVLAYALAAEDVREEFHTPLSGPLESLARQLTGNTPRVYDEIQRTFPGAEAVAEAAERVACADPDEFAELYREAGLGRVGERQEGDGE